MELICSRSQFFQISLCYVVTLAVVESVQKPVMQTPINIVSLRFNVVAFVNSEKSYYMIVCMSQLFDLKVLFAYFSLITK